MGFLNPLIPDAVGQLNQSHGLANSLVSAFQFNAAGKPVDIVNPKRGITVSNYSFDGIGGNGPSFKAATTSGYMLVSPDSGGSSAWTASARVRFPIDVNTFATFARSVVASLLHVCLNSSTDALASFTGGSARNFSPTIMPLTLSGWKRLTVTGHAGGVIAYLDGAFAGSHAFVCSSPIGSILGDSSTGGRAWGAATDYFIWNRTLSPGEVMEHALDPWAMFRNYDDWLITLLASGGGATFNPGWATGATRGIGAAFQ